MEEREQYESIAGNLVHADQGNDRLAIVVVGKDKYIFAYADVYKKGRNGVNVRKARDTHGYLLEDVRWH